MEIKFSISQIIEKFRSEIEKDGRKINSAFLDEKLGYIIIEIQEPNKEK